MTPDSSILATYTVPPHHDRVALVTPLISGGSLAGVLDFRESSPASERRRGKRSEEPIRGLDEEEIKCVTRQVIDGLAYLHEQGFLHVGITIRHS
jgi:serine/threonine-protein kinase OSR1/STK39